MAALVAVLSRPFSEPADLKQIVLFSAAGLFVSVLLILSGFDLGSTF